MEEADVTLYAEQRPAGDISQVSKSRISVSSILKNEDNYSYEKKFRLFQQILFICNEVFLSVFFFFGIFLVYIILFALKKKGGCSLEIFASCVSSVFSFGL